MKNLDSLKRLIDKNAKLTMTRIVTGS